MDDDEILGDCSSIMDDAPPATSNHPAASSSFNNVQVDESPLRPSLGRNKECKSITIVSLGNKILINVIYSAEAEAGDATPNQPTTGAGHTTL
jgi:hypothetical protein